MKEGELYLQYQSLMSGHFHLTQPDLARITEKRKSRGTSRKQVPLGQVHVLRDWVSLIVSFYPDGITISSSDCKEMKRTETIWAINLVRCTAPANLQRSMRQGRLGWCLVHELKKVGLKLAAKLAGCVNRWDSYVAAFCMLRLQLARWWWWCRRLRCNRRCTKYYGYEFQ